MGCAQSQAEYFARITASATHEARNVLAIVKESAGLVEDLLILSGPVGVPDRERVGAALGRIEAQVRRGAELMTSLNRVAHRLDRDEERVELDGAMRDVARLCERGARERRRGIEVPPASCAPAVVACPLDIYMALCLTLEWCLEQIPAGSVARVSVEGDDRRPAVRFQACLGAGPCEGFEREEWSRLVEALHGFPVQAVPDPSDACFRLVFAPAAGAGTGGAPP